VSAVDLKKHRDEIEGLVEEVKEGSHEAFSRIYDLMIDHIYRYVYFRVNKQDAEDITETVFLKVWENIGKYKPVKKQFTSWVFRIAHNLVVDYYRTKKDQTVDELKVQIQDYKREHNPIKMAERSINSDLLKEAISNLKKNYQEIIIHKFINELTNREISKILKRSEGSIRILQHRALKALRRELEELGATI